MRGGEGKKAARNPGILVSKGLDPRELTGLYFFTLLTPQSEMAIFDDFTNIKKSF